MDSELREALDQVKQEILNRIQHDVGGLNTRIDGLEKQVGGNCAKLDVQTKSLGLLRAKADKYMDMRDSDSKQLTKLNQKVNTMRHKMDDMYELLQACGENFVSIGKRVDTLEDQPNQNSQNNT